LPLQSTMAVLIGRFVVVVALFCSCAYIR
jgi:hypothetical protein